jgi:uncharacterized protein involved in outer membrane biogenesis
MRLSPRTRTTLRWTGIVLGVLVAAILLTLALVDWNSLKGPIERFASAKSGRVVRIGNLDVDVWTWTPKVTVERLTLGNVPWEPAKPMAQIEKLHVQLALLPLFKGDIVLPRVELTQPNVDLHRDGQGRANWTFESQRPTNEPAGRPPDLPTVREFIIQGGRIALRDDILHLEVNGSVQAHERGTEADPKAFRIEGRGTLNKKPFEMRVLGGPLVNLDPDEPYPFDLSIAAGDIRVAADGSVRKPFDLGRFVLNVSASGSDLADLYYLTQLALPNTPPYKIAARVERNVSKITVTRLAGTVGQSDLAGELSVDMSRKRPSVTGDLVSKQLRLADLAASLGSKPKPSETPQAEREPARPSKKGAQEQAPANARLFPVARLQVNRVRAMDADVRFRASSVQAGALPFKEVAFHIKLDEGVLSLAPFAFEMPQGKLSGTARIDARGDIPKTHLDVRVRDVQLEQLKGKAPDAKPPLGGVLQARAVFDGTGDSLHDFMADADGRVIAVVPQGEVRAAFAELTGINVARGIGLLLKGDDEKAEIRCGLAQFAVQDGTMRAQTVVFDTQDVRITGHGEIRLGPEELDLSIKGEPKKVRLARLRTPVEIGGHLRKPAIGIDAGKTLKQGAIATALGAVLTPLAAVVAFVDPGLAKDENCSALLSSTRSADSSTSTLK